MSGRDDMAFVIACRCGKRKGFLPAPRFEDDRRVIDLLSCGIAPAWAGVLICPHCDYDHVAATTIPREYAIRDVRDAQRPRPDAGV